MILVVVAAATIATSAAAIDVRGTLQVPSDFGRPAAEPEEEQRRDRYWEEWNGLLPERAWRFDAARELAVVLTGEGTMSAEQPGFAMANGSLRPATIVERVGATLTIQNTDPVVHAIYADGLADFTASPTSPALVRQQLVGTAGNWPLRDEMYPHVRGHLHVLPDLVARAVVQADGHYLFRGVAAGTYTLKIFHGAREVHSAPVIVPADGELEVAPITLGAPPAQ